MSIINFDRLTQLFASKNIIDKKKVKKIQCDTCSGSGLEHREKQICRNCNGKICNMCVHKGGLIISPYETCRKCYGDGIVKKI